MPTHPQTPCSPAVVELLHFGELSATDSRQVEAHLADCPACQRYLQQLQHLSAALPDPACVTPADCRRLQQKISARLAARTPRWRPLTGAVAAAACLAGLLLWFPTLPPASQPSLTQGPADEELLQILAALDELGDNEDFQLLAFDEEQ